MNKNSNNQSDDFLKQNNGQIDSIINQGIENNLNSYNKDLLIYIHVPFCNKKCNYCCWTAHIPSKTLQNTENIQDQYVDALCTQIQHIGPKLMRAGYIPKHIAWGGGTPSVLSIENLGKIIKVLHNSFDLSKIDEHTFESSPCSLDDKKINFLASNGVNRVSVGVQSFNNDELKTLGRPHNAEEAISSINFLKKNGINNYNIDLLFAFPEHSLNTWEQTLNQTLSLDPTHITTYLYSNVPNTVFSNLIKKGKYDAVTMEKMFQMHEYSNKLLREKGFSEVYSQCYIKDPKYLNKSEYYDFSSEGDKIGFGNGATSSIMKHFLSNNSDNDSLYRYNQNPLKFDNCIKYTPEIFNTLTEFPYTRIMHGLSISKGLNFKDFYAHYGFDFKESKHYEEILNLAQKTNLINVSDESISMSDKNRNICYIKFLIQTLRKSISNKQYNSQINN